ncbi:MAG: type 4a pilus biogenesis protein PilO [Clostridiales bacterium]|nr:type 4a pilus biogenesis protein PilO [Clostridiales bacterium]MCF8021140.1 type 4a pilus biogenesis protein PilO [Clostridiales bacterium]
MKMLQMRNFKLTSINKRQVTFVVILVAVLTFFCCYKFIIAPQWQKIEKLQVQLEKEKKELNFRMNQHWDDIPYLKKRCEEIKSEINKIHKKVPDIKNEPRLLVDLYNMAQRNNVTAGEVLFSEIREVKERNYSTFTVSTSITGTRINVYTFLRDIETYSRWNKISEIDFYPQSPSTCTCELTILFYVLPELQQSPLDYPFMKGKYGRGAPYKIFGT